MVFPQRRKKMKQGEKGKKVFYVVDVAGNWVKFAVDEKIANSENFMNSLVLGQNMMVGEDEFDDDDSGIPWVDASTFIR
jgi:hypothetical protein